MLAEEMEIVLGYFITILAIAGVSMNCWGAL